MYSPSMLPPRLFYCERLGWRNIAGYRWFPLLDNTRSQPPFQINFIPSGLRGLTQVHTPISCFPLHSRGEGGWHGAHRRPPYENRLVSPCVSMAPGGQSSFSQPGFSDGETSVPGGIFQEGFLEKGSREFPGAGLW